MSSDVDEATLRAAYCWETVDRVAGDDAMTAFKRRARYQQARWRDDRGLERGVHQAGKREPRPLGSRLMEADGEAGANFLSDGVWAAVNARLDAPEPHQTLNPDRLRRDLLSSMPMCFNLFGDLQADPKQADAAVHGWWADTPGSVRELRFEWSPGRLDRDYLGNRTAFDAAFLLEVAGGSGVRGVETKYHEHPIVERVPEPGRLRRYCEVTEQSRAFSKGALDKILKTELQQIWLDHLLVLAMLQHPSEQWTWGRFVVVYPEANEAFARCVANYRKLLTDDSTFGSTTLEQLTDPALPTGASLSAFRERYLW
jgi:hypothetical protein